MRVKLSNLKYESCLWGYARKLKDRVTRWQILHKYGDRFFSVETPRLSCYSKNSLLWIHSILSLCNEWNYFLLQKKEEKKKKQYMRFMRTCLDSNINLGFTSNSHIFNCYEYLFFSSETNHKHSAGLFKLSKKKERKKIQGNKKKIQGTKNSLCNGFCFTNLSSRCFDGKILVMHCPSAWG